MEPVNLSNSSHFRKRKRDSRPPGKVERLFPRRTQSAPSSPKRSRHIAQVKKRDWAAAFSTKSETVSGPPQKCAKQEGRLEQVSDIFRLPPEILAFILGKLDVDQLFRAGEVCRLWRDIAEDVINSQSYLPVFLTAIDERLQGVGGVRDCRTPIRESDVTEPLLAWRQVFCSTSGIYQGSVEELPIDKAQVAPLMRVFARCSLQEHHFIGLSGATPIHVAAHCGDAAAVSLWLKTVLDNKRGYTTLPVDKEGRSPLHLAVRKGKISVIQRLRNGISSYQPTDDARSPLALAVRLGNQKAVDQFLENTIFRLGVIDEAMRVAALYNRGAIIDRLARRQDSNTNNPNRQGASPLHEACQWGCLAAAQALLRHGAYPWPTNGRGETPLHLAARHGHAAMVNLLLERSTQNSCGVVESLPVAQQRPWVDAPAAGGMTPLHYACEQGRYHAAKVLLQAGADCMCVTEKGLTAMHCAASSGHLGLLQLLFAHAPKTINLGPETPLRVAVDAKQVDAAKILLEAGADPTKVDSLGRLPIHTAAEGHQTAMLRLLLADGKQTINTKILKAEGTVYPGATPLWLACWTGEEDAGAVAESVRVLLEAGADPTVADERGWLPIHALACDADAATIQLVLQYAPATINVQAEGETPLWCACERGNVEAVKVFLEVGADTQLADTEGMTPLQVAQKGGHQEIVQLLQQYEWAQVCSFL